MVSNRYIKIEGWAAAILLITAIVLIYSPYASYTHIPLYFGFLAGFLALIESKHDRLSKGFGLIFFGVLLGIAFPIIFKARYDGELPEELKVPMDIFTNIVIFSCSGAGASILANHAEQTHCSPTNNTSEENIINRNTLNIIHKSLQKIHDRDILHTRLLITIVIVLSLLLFIIMVK